MAAAICFGLQYPGAGRYCCHCRIVCNRIVCRKRIGPADSCRVGQPVGADSGCEVHLFECEKVSESLLSDSSRSFKTPVLVPFPQSGIWTIAFVSGQVSNAVKAALPKDGDYLSVYVPTTPNPTGGYYIMVKKSDVRELDMSVDEALKYVISLGMVIPDDLPVKTLAGPMPSEKADLPEQQ